VYSISKQIHAKFQPDQLTFGEMAVEKPVSGYNRTRPCQYLGIAVIGYSY